MELVGRILLFIRTLTPMTYFLFLRTSRMEHEHIVNERPLRSLGGNGLFCEREAGLERLFLGCLRTLY